jgi:hypothetical protein
MGTAKPVPYLTQTRFGEKLELERPRKSGEEFYRKYLTSLQEFGKRYDK